ncbi:MAG: hypothetical protein V4582_22045 [Pseudomonadota bacterium]
MAEQIQCIFPDEPEWETVPDDALIELVQTYYQEPSCATTAIGLLSRRKHPEARNLASWLLLEDNADQWLKNCASRVLEEDKL